MTLETILCARCGAPGQLGQRFCGQCGSAIGATAQVGGASEEAAENRLLTIIFSDIVNSTYLTDRLGAEAFRDILRDYRERAARCFHKYGGFIARFFGDGTLVYFGYPSAHEDDAWRAVQASLELQSSLKDLNRHYLLDREFDFRVRMVVHTGTVVVGDIRSDSATERMAIVGNAPNIAARLQESSEPGAVTISAATYRPVHHAFDCVCLGDTTVKGIAEPITIYRVNGEARRRGRLALRGQTTPMIGRERPLAELAAAWESASSGQGALVQLVGEAGVGKTRLVSEFASQLDSRNRLRMVWRCSPLHENTALFPLIQHLSNALGLAQPKTAADKIASIERAFESEPPDRQYVELVASLFGINLPPERYDPLGVSPEQQRYLLQERLLDWLVNATRNRPVLLVVEDLHWADPSTLEMLAKSMPRIKTSRVLLVVTSRPVPPGGWVENAWGTTITLDRLSDEDTKRMIETVAGDHRLGSATIEALSTRMEGVPLFIEEITRAVVEAEGSGTGRSGRPTTIPATLQESLAGRIDRAGVNRELLQFSATLGREFSVELLGAIWGGDRGLLLRELDKLLNAGLLQTRKIGGQTVYQYSHALILDAIYQFQLSGQRQANHQRVADVLTREFPEMCERSPEVVANHFLEGANPAAALPYLQRAAQTAMQRSANIEAARYLQLALETMPALPADQARIYTELELLTSLGVVQSARFGFASNEAGTTFARARVLCRDLGRLPGLFPILHGLYRFHHVRVELGTAASLSREMLNIARDQFNPALLLEAHRAAGNCRFLTGAFGKAERHFNRTMALYQTQDHYAHRFEYGTDPFVVAASMGAITSCVTGSGVQAHDLMAQALSTAEELNHPYSVCWALSFAAVLSAIHGDVPGVSEYSERQLALAKRNGFGFWELPPNIMLGWTAARLEPGGDGIERMRIAIKRWRGSGAIAYLPFFLSHLADALFHAGRAGEAAATIAEARDLAEQTGELWWRAEMHRLGGLCALAVSALTKAEDQFRAAIAVAQRQHAYLLAERAETDLESLRKPGRVPGPFTHQH